MFHRTKPHLLVLTLALFSIAEPCFAHRLDEYLQAAKVSIEPDRIGIDLRLTPGTAVVSELIPLLDRDQDGSLSLAEELAYADRVRGELSLTIDGQPTALRLIS